MRILVVDDHEVVRKGLRALLEGQPGWEVSGEAANGREAVQKAAELRPDVIVLDVTMPELNGLGAARQILKAVPETQILILTMHESAEVVREALDAGARGYLLKSDAGRELVAAVGALQRHKPFFGSKVSEIMQGCPIEPGEDDGAKQHLGALTPRELEIIQLLAEGKTNKDIATSLGITVKTSETHRTNIMRKLDLHSMADVVRYALRNKIVKP